MSVQAVQLNSTGAIKGVGNINISNNIIDCASLGLGIWYRRLDGIIIQGNVVSRSSDRTKPTPGILEADDVTRKLVSAPFRQCKLRCPCSLTGRAGGQQLVQLSG